MQQERIYFPGLNALRFIAALSVVLVHIEQFKGLFGIASGEYSDFFFLARIGMTGRDAVTLFFVLSGFLITYLLLTEENRTGTIAVRKFYVRRFLRIWPLYYLLVFLGFIVVPAFVQITNFQGYYESIRHDFFAKLSLYVLFLPNVAPILRYFPLGIAHLWTIGVEEQFYLLWPALLKIFRKRALPVLLAILIFKIAIVLFKQAYVFSPDLTIADFVLRFLLTFQIESMAIGGIGAYLLVYQKQRILNVLFHPIIEKVILVLMLAHVLALPSIIITDLTTWTTDFVLSTLYMLFMLNLSSNPRSTLKLENRALNALGKLSYGIYMYHAAIIYMVMIIFDRLGWGLDDSLLYNLVLYAVVVGATIGLSALSYQYFELRFLRLKERFTVVRSGDAITVPASGD